MPRLPALPVGPIGPPYIAVSQVWSVPLDTGSHLPIVPVSQVHFGVQPGLTTQVQSNARPPRVLTIHALQVLPTTKRTIYVRAVRPVPMVHLTLELDNAWQAHPVHQDTVSIAL